MDTSTAGAKSGTATIALASDGTGTSGFSALGIGSQTVNVSGDVYRLAAASAHTPEPVVLANQRVGGSCRSSAEPDQHRRSDGFSESLNANFSGTTGNVTCCRQL